MSRDGQKNRSKQFTTEARSPRSRFLVAGVRLAWAGRVQTVRPRASSEGVATARVSLDGSNPRPHGVDSDRFGYRPHAGRPSLTGGRVARRGGSSYCLYLPCRDITASILNSSNTLDTPFLARGRGSRGTGACGPRLRAARPSAAASEATLSVTVRRTKGRSIGIITHTLKRLICAVFTAFFACAFCLALLFYVVVKAFMMRWRTPINEQDGQDSITED